MVGGALNLPYLTVNRMVSFTLLKNIFVINYGPPPTAMGLSAVCDCGIS